MVSTVSRQVTKVGSTPLFWPGHGIFISGEAILAPNITISLQKATDTIKLRWLAEYSPKSVLILSPSVLLNVVYTISFSHQCRKKFPDFSGYF